MLGRMRERTMSLRELKNAFVFPSPICKALSQGCASLTVVTMPTSSPFADNVFAFYPHIRDASGSVKAEPRESVVWEHRNYLYSLPILVLGGVKRNSFAPTFLGGELWNSSRKSRQEKPHRDLESASTPFTPFCGRESSLRERWTGAGAFRS